MSADGYVNASSFECAGVTVGAAGEDCVALATPGEVHVVGRDDRITVEIEGDVVDLAVGHRVYVATAASVIALSRGGTRVWSVDLDGPRRLAALAGEDVLAVIAGDDRLIGFDGETGTERFTRPRPRADIGDDPILVAGADRFVVATWSFVSLVTPDGEDCFETDLQGAIRDVGVVDGTVVAALQNDRLVGVDAASGDRRWERELAVESLPDRGEGELVVAVETELVSIGPDGSTRVVTDVPAGRTFVASSGDPLCVVADDTVSVYRARESVAAALEAGLPDPVIPSGDSGGMAVEVSNPADHGVSTVLHAGGEGLEVTPAEQPLDIAPNSTTTVEYAVEPVDRRGTPVFRLRAEDTTLIETGIETGPAVDIDIEASLDALASGTARIAVTVRNAGTQRAAGVEVRPGDVSLGPLDPGQESTVTVDVPFRAGATASISAAADTGDSTETQVSFPAEVVAVEPSVADAGFIDVRLSNRLDVPVSDRIAVGGSCFRDAIERSIDVPPGAVYVLALRPETEGRCTVEATIEGLDLAHESTVEVTSAATTGPLESTGSERSAPGEAEAESTTADRSTDGHARIEAERAFSTSDPLESQGFQERIRVWNEGDDPAREVTYRSADESVSLGDLDPGDRVVLSRAHAFSDAGQRSVSGGSIRVSGDEAATIADRTFEIEAGEFAAEGVFVSAGDDRSIELRLSNRRDAPCSVSRIGAKGVDVWASDDVEIGPGETVEWRRSIPEEEFPDRAAVEAAVEYTFADREGTEQFGTLLPVVAATGDGLAGLSISIGDETRIVEGRGSVVVEVANAGHTPVADVSVAASGDAVDDMMYGGEKSVDRLDPGEAFEHMIDVSTDADAAELSLEVAGTVDGETERETVGLSGPVAADADEWGADLLEEWTVDRDGGGGGPAPPSHVVTEFSRDRRGGNPR